MGEPDARRVAQKQQRQHSDDDRETQDDQFHRDDDRRDRADHRNGADQIPDELSEVFHPGITLPFW